MIIRSFGKDSPRFSTRNSQRLFYQIGCDRESVGFGNHFLEIACIIAIRRLIEHLIKEKRKVG